MCLTLPSAVDQQCNLTRSSCTCHTPSVPITMCCSWSHMTSECCCICYRQRLIFRHDDRLHSSQMSTCLGTGTSITCQKQYFSTNSVRFVLEFQEIEGGIKFICACCWKACCRSDRIYIHSQFQESSQLPSIFIVVSPLLSIFTGRCRRTKTKIHLHPISVMGSTQVST